jgi:hypothetical protein
LEWFLIFSYVFMATIGYNFYFYFQIRIAGGGVELGSLGTSVINWRIIPAAGDYEGGEFGGMMIGKGNRGTRRKPAPMPLCSPQISHELTGREPGPPRWETSI